MSLQANCPSCGAPVSFKVGTSLVTVCEYCRSVVGRGDRGLESLGKVADLVESNSPLDVWVKGRWEKRPFDLTGRTQFNHPGGGVWDEWYLAFPDGKWGWLAEAGGRFYLTFEAPAPAKLPSYDELVVGQRVTLGEGQEFVVAEKNTATVGGAKGEMPYRVVPGSAHPFADLSGPRGQFATLDYSGPAPAVYVGREVTLDELGIPKGHRRKYPGQEPKVAAVALNCPNCGGAISLRAPDHSERVGCPSCGSLLSVAGGKLSLLKSLKKPNVVPVIPLGAVGKRDDVEWACLGFLRRCVSIDGVDYDWEEYLLYQPRLGFRWLTRSDHHWNWVEPIPPGSVEGDGKYVHYAGRSYALFQSAEARVRLVYGEFYWKVEAGEKVEALDFVSAPFMLSMEKAGDGGSGEINWSRGEYIQAAEVQRMFSLPEALPAPTTVGPNQPFPHTGVYWTFAALAAIVLLLAILWWATSPAEVVLSKTFKLPAKQKEEGATQTVTLKRTRNLRVTIRPRSGEWAGVSGKFSRDGVVQEDFAVWALEGESAYVYLSALPAGEYDVPLTFSWRGGNTDGYADLTVESGVAHPSPVVATLLLLGLFPFGVAMYQLVWERRRWADSNVN